MPECEAYPDMRAHEDARLTDEVPESVCFIIMDSKNEFRGKLPEKLRRHTRIHRKPMAGYFPEHRKRHGKAKAFAGIQEMRWLVDNGFG